MKKNGYTLIELIVTIGLIATAATVILVNVVGMKDTQVEANSEKYINAIEDAACAYIDMSNETIMQLRKDCKGNEKSQTWKRANCNIPLSVLISDDYALLDPDLKNPDTNCTAEQEKDRIEVYISFGEGEIKEKKCELNWKKNKEICKK